MAIDPGFRDALKHLADHTGMTVEQIGNLTWEQLAALRDQAQQRLDEANAKIAWADAALAVLDDPEGDGR